MTLDEDRFCLEPLSACPFRLIHLFVVPEPPQIGGFRTHQSRLSSCPLPSRLVPRSWIRKRSHHRAHAQQATGGLPFWRHQGITKYLCLPESHLQRELGFHLPLHLLWDTRDEWQWKHRLTGQRSGCRS